MLMITKVFRYRKAGMNMKGRYPYYEVKGDTFYEIGKCYGTQAKEYIEFAVNEYKDYFSRHYKKRSWDKFIEYAMAFVPSIEEYGPELMEQMRGIADGSGCSLEDLMVINTRYEITKMPADECTTGAVLPEAAKDGGCYMVKNWDMRAGVRDFVVNLHYILPDGTRIMGCTEAGQLLREGMNSYGIAIANNALGSTLDNPGTGIPVTFIRMKVLSSKSYEEAVENFEKAPRSVANNTILGCGDGRIVNYEAYPGGFAKKLPVAGILTHANHFEVRPEINKYSISQRSDRLRKLLFERYGKIDVQAIKEVMSDHKDIPQSLCAHPCTPDIPMADRRMTIQSLIYDFTGMCVHIADGPPCETEYIRFDV